MEFIPIDTNPTLTNTKPTAPRLESAQTAHLRDEYPCIEWLEQGHAANWLMDRKQQLLIFAEQERSGIAISKTLGIVTTAAGFLLHATSPVAPIGALLGIAGLAWAVLKDKEQTHKFAPFPFVRDGVLDVGGRLGNAALREEHQGMDEFEQLKTYLPPVEQKEYQMLRDYLPLITDYLAQVEPLKRFHAYRWILHCFIEMRGFPQVESLHKHMENVAVDVRVNPEHLVAIQEMEAQQALPQPMKTKDFPKYQPENPPLIGSNTKLNAIQVTPMESVYTPPTPKKPLDIIAKMSTSPINQLIIGIPGSGKGLVVSNALRAIKAKHPHIKIFYIDPKNESKETGYFQGCVDILKRASTDLMEPSEIASWFKNCIKEFDSLGNDKLLVFDEGTQIGSQLKIAKQLDWLKGKLTSYASCGDSRGIYVWILAQNPHTDDLGISGGLRSQFCPLAIVSGKNIAAYGAMTATNFIPSGQRIPDEKLQEYIDNSPVNRAVYHGGLNAWFPMPLLENHSGYDRDSRAFLQNHPTNNQTSNDEVQAKKEEISLEAELAALKKKREEMMSSKTKQFWQILERYFIENQRSVTITQISNWNSIRELYNPVSPVSKADQIREWVREIQEKIGKVTLEDDTVQLI